MASPNPQTPADGINGPVGPLRPLWDIDRIIRDAVGAEPNPANPFTSPITPLSQQLAEQLQAVNPPLPIPTTPPMWLADP